MFFPGCRRFKNGLNAYQGSNLTMVFPGDFHIFLIKRPHAIAPGYTAPFIVSAHDRPAVWLEIPV